MASSSLSFHFLSVQHLGMRNISCLFALTPGEVVRSVARVCRAIRPPEQGSLWATTQQQKRKSKKSKKNKKKSKNNKEKNNNHDKTEKKKRRRKRKRRVNKAQTNRKHRRKHVQGSNRNTCMSTYRQKKKEDRTKR